MNQRKSQVERQGLGNTVHTRQEKGLLKLGRLNAAACHHHFCVVKVRVKGSFALAMFHKPLIFSNIDGLLAVETTRLGGVSPAPFSSLNLGRSSGDEPENVIENKRLLAAALGVKPEQFVTGHQVHGDEICVVEKPGNFNGFDAKITDRPGLLLTVTAADCVPTLVFDKRNRAIAAVHAGWRGTVAGLVGKTVLRMKKEFGTLPEDCLAWVGTCIGVEDFEVGNEVARLFSGEHKVWDEARGKYRVDLKTANRDQLLRIGVPAGQVEVSRFSTVGDNDRFFSFRKEGPATGRFWGVIGMV